MAEVNFKEDAMVVTHFHAADWLGKRIDERDASDPLRQLLEATLNKQMSAEADSVCGIPTGCRVKAA